MLRLSVIHERNRQLLSALLDNAEQENASVNLRETMVWDSFMLQRPNAHWTTVQSSCTKVKEMLWRHSNRVSTPDSLTGCEAGRIPQDRASLLLDCLHSQADPWAEPGWREQPRFFGQRHDAAFGASDTGGLRTRSESEGIGIHETIQTGEFSDSSRMVVDLNPS